MSVVKTMSLVNIHTCTMYNIQIDKKNVMDYSQDVNQSYK